MGLRLNHIGYAVEDIERYWNDFFQPLFEPCGISRVYEDPLQKVRVAFITLASGERVELVEPMDESSPVSRILKARRGGFYHLCYEARGLEPEIKRFEEKGCRLISGPTPAVAFEGRRIAFLYTPQNDVIELVEAP
ncbi:MAG: VOC family protein [Elusimicrobia bacterium]|nr:VOC family protein [Elusimicrobiota bacterium]